VEGDSLAHRGHDPDDLYHTGEINHLRSLLQQTDRWKYEGATL
jgi:hypothetical protein